MENQTKTAAENYIFKPFNLDEALKYPHRVWSNYRKCFAVKITECIYDFLPRVGVYYALNDACSFNVITFA